ncbi:hypothetical protein HanLR1_Chr00c0407g0748981 [Helianthus annuus]|nr:hypothetical protein HanLR1_Chr00c0407g0748981 [Helianthus annuus]
MVDQNIFDTYMIKEKIASVLKDLKFREQHVLVQFWSPVPVRKRWLLTTWDQPFGLGLYRKKSELCPIVADLEHREKLGSPGRVYIHKLPEWSLDVHTSYNIHGYINLPVFESSSDSCVGVLEIITSSSYADFAFEVEEVARTLKTQNLKSPNVFEDRSLSVSCVPSNLYILSQALSLFIITCSNFNSSTYEQIYWGFFSLKWVR